MAHRKVAIALTALAVVCIAAFVVVALVQVFPRLPERRRAPDFTLTGWNGTVFTLSQFRGAVVLLEFMHTTCPSCVAEIDELRLVRDARPDAVILSVSVQRESYSVLEEFATLHNVTWLLAPDTLAENVAGRYSVSAVPSLVVVDQEGYKAETYVGGSLASVLIEKIDALLGLEFATATKPGRYDRLLDQSCTISGRKQSS